MLNVKKVLDNSTRAEKIAGFFTFLFTGLTMLVIAVTFYAASRELLICLPMFAFVGYCFWQADRCLKAAQAKSASVNRAKELEHEKLLTAAIEKAERENPAFHALTKLLS